MSFLPSIVLSRKVAVLPSPADSCFLRPTAMFSTHCLGWAKAVFSECMHSLSSTLSLSSYAAWGQACSKTIKHIPSRYPAVGESSNTFNGWGWPPPQSVLFFKLVVLSLLFLVYQPLSLWLDMPCESCCLLPIQHWVHERNCCNVSMFLKDQVLTKSQ